MSSADDAFLVNALTIGNQYGPNPFSKFAGPLPQPSYQGAATDARGVNVYGKPGSDYLGLLSNPGPVTTPGAQAPTGAQPMSVLDSFLNNNKGGTGAGGMYSNQPFFNTLNAMRTGAGSTGAGAGVDTNISPPVYQSPAPARPVYAQPAAPPAAAPAAAATVPPGTTLNSIYSNAMSSLNPLQGLMGPLMDQQNPLSASDRAALGTKTLEYIKQNQAADIAKLLGNVGRPGYAQGNSGASGY